MTSSNGSNGKAPVPHVVKITPAWAEDVLTRNSLNRPLREGRVERYAADMKAGRWQLNGETIKITKDGQLIDGQHRLFAVLESETTIESYVVEGLDMDVMPTIDTGGPRTMSDVLAIGGGKHTAMHAALLRWVAWYEMRPRPAGGPSGTSGLTHTMLLEVAADNPDAVDAAATVNSNGKAKRMVTGSALAFVYLMALRTDPGKAGAWLELLGTGANLDPVHPVHLLRERMIANAAAKTKLPIVDACALTIKSWNNFLTGARPKTLRWSAVEEFPTFARRQGGG